MLSIGKYKNRFLRNIWGGYDDRSVLYLHGCVSFSFWSMGFVEWCKCWFGFGYVWSIINSGWFAVFGVVWMKRVIQNRKGQKKGERGIKVLFLSPDGKSKSFTIHGYSLKEASDRAYFLFYTENYKNNERIREGKHG